MPRRPATPRGVAEQVSRLAVGASVATGEIAWLAQELDLTSALDVEIATAGVAITGLQASLLAIAAAVQEVAEAGGPGEAFASADALRNAALALDELLPAYQPARLAGRREERPEQRAAERLRRLRVRGRLDLDVGAVVGELDGHVDRQRLQRDVVRPEEELRILICCSVSLKLMPTSRNRPSSWPVEKLSLISGAIARSPA